MRSALVTGASRGLGLELVRQYSADGWQVVACARSPKQGDELARIADGSQGRIEVRSLDVTDFAAIDLLLNVAGTMGVRGKGFGSSDFAEWEAVFRLNAFAPMKMAEAFAPHVARSSERKIVSVSTIMASMGKNTLGGFYAYRASKAALNAIVVSMAIDLGRRHGILAAVIHPGWVRTDMGGPRADIDAATSVAGMRQVIAGLTKDRAGKFWSYDGSEISW